MVFDNTTGPHATTCYEHIILTMRHHEAACSPLSEEDATQTTLVDEMARPNTIIEMMRIDPRSTVSGLNI